MECRILSNKKVSQVVFFFSNFENTFAYFTTWRLHFGWRRWSWTCIRPLPTRRNTKFERADCAQRKKTKKVEHRCFFHHVNYGAVLLLFERLFSKRMYLERSGCTVWQYGECFCTSRNVLRGMQLRWGWDCNTILIEYLTREDTNGALLWWARSHSWSDSVEIDLPIVVRACRARSYIASRLTREWGRGVSSRKIRAWRGPTRGTTEHDAG